MASSLSPKFKFGRVEADGERVLIHVTVTMGPFEHPMRVALSEESASRLIAQVQSAIAALGRTRLGA
jgi:hypothetical protein